MSKRKLSELRVADLKNELSKRKLIVSGLKHSLVKRLSLALTEEEKDPSTFKFAIGEEVASAAVGNKQDRVIPEESNPKSQFSQVIPKIEPNNSSTEIAIEDSEGNSNDQTVKDEDITLSDHSFSEFSQEAKTVAVGIVPSNFPTKSLTKAQMNSIQESIDFKVLNQKYKTFKPKFSWIEFKCDWLSLKCSNRATAEWLKIAVKDIVCQEFKLKVVEGKDLPEDQMIETTFPESAHMETTTILGFIESQNENLQTEYWKLLRRQQKTTSSIMTFSVSQTVIKELKNCGYKIHFRYGTVVFNRRYIPLTNTQIDNPTKTLPIQNQPNPLKPTAPKPTVFKPPQCKSQASVVPQAKPTKDPKRPMTETQRRRYRRQIKAAMASVNEI